MSIALVGAHICLPSRDFHWVNGVLSTNIFCPNARHDWEPSISKRPISFGRTAIGLIHPVAIWVPNFHWMEDLNA